MSREPSVDEGGGGAGLPDCAPRGFAGNSSSRTKKAAAVFLVLVWAWAGQGVSATQGPQKPGERTGGAASAKEKTNAAAEPTSPTAKTPEKEGFQLFQLGDLGGNWANVYLGQLRGEIGRANFSTDNGEISYMSMVGLIRIESERFNLECENLTFDKPTDRLEARYNVHVVLHQEGVDARCGHLAYDLAKNVIVLTVDPHVFYKTEKGLMEAYNMKSLTITMRPDNKTNISIEGSETVFKMRSQETGGTKASDLPTTPAAPQEITPETFARPPQGSPTPSPVPTKK